MQAKIVSYVEALMGAYLGHYRMALLTVGLLLERLAPGTHSVL